MGDIGRMSRPRYTTYDYEFGYSKYNYGGTNSLGRRYYNEGGGYGYNRSQNTVHYTRADIPEPKREPEPAPQDMRQRVIAGEFLDKLDAAYPSWNGSTLFSIERRSYIKGDDTALERMLKYVSLESTLLAPLTRAPDEIITVSRRGDVQVLRRKKARRWPPRIRNWDVAVAYGILAMYLIGIIAACVIASL